jgi:diketogulonate reductase-like aldo/keto reductase
MEEIEPTQQVLDSIAKDHNVSMSAVALNYSMSKGVLPLAGIRRPQQAEQNMQAFGWRPSNEEILRIDSVSVKGKATKMWQHG